MRAPNGLLATKVATTPTFLPRCPRWHLLGLDSYAILHLFYLPLLLRLLLVLPQFFCGSSVVRWALHGKVIHRPSEKLGHGRLDAFDSKGPLLGGVYLSPCASMGINLRSIYRSNLPKGYLNDALSAPRADKVSLQGSKSCFVCTQIGF